MDETIHVRAMDHEVDTNFTKAGIAISHVRQTSEQIQMQLQVTKWLMSSRKVIVLPSSLFQIMFMENLRQINHTSKISISQSGFSFACSLSHLLPQSFFLWFSLSHLLTHSYVVSLALFHAFFPPPSLSHSFFLSLTLVCLHRSIFSTRVKKVFM